MKPLLAGLLLLITAAPTFAQDAPAIEVRAAVGASHYLHGDLAYTAPALLVSVRAGHGPFAVEPEFVIASHERTEKFGIATAATSNDRFESVAVNFIGRGHGAVAAFGGGGIGFYSERYRYRLDDGDRGYSQSRTQGPRLGAQAVAGIDVAITSHIKGFGEFRYEVRSFDDPGGGSVVQGFGGISIVLK